MINKYRFLSKLFIVFVGFLSILLPSCSKSNNSNSTNFTYTYTDSIGIIHTISDYSILSNGKYIINGNTLKQSTYPVCFSTYQPSSGYDFQFNDFKDPTGLGDLVIIVPNLNNSNLQGNYPTNSVPSVIILFNGSQTVLGTFTISTTYKSESGSFTITGNTLSGKPISISGSFTNMGSF